jgi:serine/threonine protein kinase
MPPELWDKLDLGLQLGSGLTARVVAGNRRTDGRRVAVKIIDKRELTTKALDLTRQEANVLFRVQHENIVNLLACHETPSFLYLELERCEGGELLRAITEQHHYSEATAKEVALRIASALVHLHSLGILHRDLKPENVLLVSTDDRTDVKLADFGLAKVFSAELSAPGSSTKATPSVVEPDHHPHHRSARLATASPLPEDAGLRGTDSPRKSTGLMQAMDQQRVALAADHTTALCDEFEPGQWPQPATRARSVHAVSTGLGQTAWEATGAKPGALEATGAKPGALEATSSAASVSSSGGLAGVVALSASHSAPSLEGAITRMRSLNLSPRVGLAHPSYRVHRPWASSGAASAEQALLVVPPYSPQPKGGFEAVAHASTTPQPTSSPPLQAMREAHPPTLGRTSTVCGSARYIAPEVEAGQAYGHKADWYSFGVFLHALLVGEFPPLAVYGQTKPPVLGAPAWGDVSPDAKAAVSRLLHPDPEQRDGGHEFLSSEWVCGAHARTTPLARAQSSLVEYAREARF